MNELTAKAADVIIKICGELVVDNIEGEKSCSAWCVQKIEKIEEWAKAIRDAHRSTAQTVNKEA
jgi:hypothetical protein